MGSIRLLKPHINQQKVLKSNKRFIVLMCGRRFGKSTISIFKCIKQLFENENQKVAYITPTYKLAKDFFKDILSRIIDSGMVVSANRSDFTISLLNGSVIEFFSGENIDTQIRGKNFDLIIIDEAAKLPNFKASWEDGIQPTTVDTLGKVMIVSTPRGHDFFNELYNRGNDPLFEEWESFHFTSYDNPYLPSSEIDRIKKEVSKASFDQEYMAMPSENQNAIVTSDVINRNTIEELSNKQAVIYGIDLARTHDYVSVTGLDIDGKMCYHNRFNKVDWPVVIERLLALPSSTPKVIDSTGVGDVVVSLLNQKINNILPYKFDNTSKNNLINKLITSLEQDKLKFNEITASELSTYEKKINENTRFITYNGIAGCYDDCVISLALANFYLDNYQTSVSSTFSF